MPFHPGTTSGFSRLFMLECQRHHHPTMLDFLFQFALELARALLVDEFSSHVRARVVQFLISHRDSRWRRMGWREYIRHRPIHRLPTDEEEDS
jgi:hypothetical protein